MVAISLDDLRRSSSRSLRSMITVYQRPSLWRQTMNDPFWRLPVVPSFTVTSTDVTDGPALPPAQMSGIFGVPGGKDISPQLSWSGAPAETKSYTVTMYDPDVPSGSGFWHWALADIPASVTGLPAGAGDGTGEHLPTGAFHFAAALPNDARLARFIGAAPPPGDGRHRYVIVVQAIGIERVGQLRVQADSTPAWLGLMINTSGHLLARAVITAWAEIPAA
jgi:Raf kinase inhibitor-like YbhB/YbcL family protein